jgi:hypothetical protein
MKKRTILLLAFLAACAGCKPEDVQTVGIGGLGWHFTAVQNRIQPAIPPVLEFLRQRYPDIRPAEPPKPLAAAFQKAILEGPARLQAHFDSRLVAAMTVTGLPCAAESFPVRDAGKTVAAFVVLDITALTGPPESWKPCSPVRAGEGGDRVAALRGLLGGLLDAAALAN